MFSFKAVKQLAMQATSYSVTRGIRLNSPYYLLCQGFHIRSSVSNKWTNEPPSSDFVRPRYLNLSAETHGTLGRKAYVDETYTENSRKLKILAKKPNEPTKDSGSTQPLQEVSVKSYGYGQVRKPCIEETYTKVVDRLIEESKRRNNPPKKPNASTKGSDSTQKSQEAKDIKMTLIKEGGQLKGKFTK